MGDWIYLIGDKLWNLIEYFDFEPRKVYSDRNLTYSPWCIWRQISYEKLKNKNHRFQNFIAFNIQAKWILCGTMTISYLELFLKYFWVGNYKQCKYQKSVRLPALNFCNIRENHHHHYLFVDLSVGAAHLCDSMKLFIVLLPFLGLVYCSAAPTDIEKRSAMGLYIMIVYFFCSLYFVFKMIIFFSFGDFPSP